MKVKLYLLMLALFVLANPMMAQEAAGGGASWRGPFSVLAMAFASGICGLAQAKAVAASAEGMARNPGASAAIRFALILGLALIESLALYTLVIILAG